MDNLINDMLAKNLNVAKYDLHEYWLDIGGVDEYKQAQTIYNENFK